MLRRIELEVLATVKRGDTISELATTLDHSESYLSRAVADLAKKRLVYIELVKGEKQFVWRHSFAGRIPVQLLDKLLARARKDARRHCPR